jgi:hypothetical protein
MRHPRGDRTRSRAHGSGVGIYTDLGHVIAYTGGEVRQQVNICTWPRPSAASPCPFWRVIRAGVRRPADLDDNLPIDLTQRLRLDQPPRPAEPALHRVEISARSMFGTNLGSAWGAKRQRTFTGNKRPVTHRRRSGDVLNVSQQLPTARGHAPAYRPARPLHQAALNWGPCLVRSAPLRLRRLLWRRRRRGLLRFRHEPPLKSDSRNVISASRRINRTTLKRPYTGQFSPRCAGNVAHIGGSRMVHIRDLATVICPCGQLIAVHHKFESPRPQNPPPSEGGGALLAFPTRTLGPVNPFKAVPRKGRLHPGDLAGLAIGRQAIGRNVFIDVGPYDRWRRAWICRRLRQ